MEERPETKVYSVSTLLQQQVEAINAVTHPLFEKEGCATKLKEATLFLRAKIPTYFKEPTVSSIHPINGFTLDQTRKIFMSHFTVWGEYVNGPGTGINLFSPREQLDAEESMMFLGLIVQAANGPSELAKNAKISEGLAEKYQILQDGPTGERIAEETKRQGFERSLHAIELFLDANTLIISSADQHDIRAMVKQFRESIEEFYEIHLPRWQHVYDTLSLQSDRINSQENCIE